MFLIVVIEAGVIKREVRRRSSELLYAVLLIRCINANHASLNGLFSCTGR
jgi:hypothetical protein